MFLALLTSLPAGTSTLRMRVWRSLKAMGCGVLRDGVYLLPAGASTASALAEAEAEVRAAGGFAMTAEMNFGPEQLAHVRGLFDRSEEYAALRARIGAGKAALRRLGQRKGETLVRRLRRSLEDVARIDFFPGHAKLQAEEAMAALERGAQAAFSPGEPHAAMKSVRRLDPSKFRRRNWATRKDLWVDRLASAWLIRRFIDKDARFVWIDHPRVRPKGAIGFDFDGAQFTHVGGRVTFEVLASSFGLDGDPALTSIGHAVHALDVGGIPVADAKGLETILRGIKSKAQGDDETAREAFKVFDLLYSAYAQESAVPANADA